MGGAAPKRESVRHVPDDEHGAAPQAAPRRTGVAPPTGEPVVHLKYVNFGPFIYKQMIDSVSGRPADGDIVAVADTRGELFGWAFWHGSSQIALRMITHAPARPDDATLAARVASAVALRRDLLRLDATTDAYRLVHAEGDGLSGLVADRFGRVVVIELFSVAMYRRLTMIEDAFIDAGLDVSAFVVRADPRVCEQEGFALGKAERSKAGVAVITENGVPFQVDLAAGHKTGFFCDQRDNRLAFSQLTAGRSVLDVCCYTGGFGIYAAKLGGAASVSAVDLDEKALEVARANARLNEVSVRFTHDDAFDFLRRAAAEGRTWQAVVVDPSKFVRRRSELELGLHKYADLNRLACQAVAPGGLLLTCSCSGLVDAETFIQTVGKASRSAGRELKIFRVSSAAGDHPRTPGAPEAGYLKAVWARVE